MTKKQLRAHIGAQWQEMLAKGTIPVMEFPVMIDGKKEWLIVDVLFPVTRSFGALVKEEYNSSYIVFSFDNHSLPVYFDGDIVGKGGPDYRIPLDEYFPSLDYYLQRISDNIMEGFILANNIFCGEED